MQKVECWKCAGTGIVYWALHYANGVCFACKGSGKLDYRDATLQEQRNLFVHDRLCHKVIRIAECRNRKRQIFISATQGGKADISLRQFGKARDHSLCIMDLHNDAEAREVWKAARALATEHDAEFVPYVYLSPKMSPEALAAVDEHAHAYCAKHAPTFGFVYEREPRPAFDPENNS
jgi:hypothetical protein